MGDCLYLPLTAPDGGIVNDPVFLKLAGDRYWLSIADSDVLLYALGLAAGAGLNVEVSEPDVSPLAVQGPRAEDLMACLFGEDIRRVGFFEFDRFDFGGVEQVVARSGYSGRTDSRSISGMPLSAVRSGMRCGRQGGRSTLRPVAPI